MPFLVGLILGFGLVTGYGFVRSKTTQVSPQLELLHSQIDQETKKISDLEIELQSLQKKKDELDSSDSTVEKKKLTDQINQIKEDLKNLSESVQENERKKLNLPGEIQKLEFEKELAAGKIESSKIILTGLEQQIAFYENQKISMQNDLAKIKGSSEPREVTSESASPQDGLAIDSNIIILGQDVNLREEPSRTGKSIALLSANLRGKVLESGEKESIGKWGEHRWYKIRLDNGKVGWVFGGCIQGL